MGARRARIIILGRGGPRIITDPTISYEIAPNTIGSCQIYQIRHNLDKSYQIVRILRDLGNKWPPNATPKPPQNDPQRPVGPPELCAELCADYARSTFLEVSAGLAFLKIGSRRFAPNLTRSCKNLPSGRNLEGICKGCVRNMQGICKQYARQYAWNM